MVATRISTGLGFNITAVSALGFKPEWDVTMIKFFWIDNGVLYAFNTIPTLIWEPRAVHGCPHFDFYLVSASTFDRPSKCRNLVGSKECRARVTTCSLKVRQRGGGVGEIIALILSGFDGS